MIRSTPTFGLARFAVVICLTLASGLFLVGIPDGSWLVGHEERIRYLALGEQFRTALLETWRYPRWLPDMYGGYGYPTFVFYQPLIFFVYAAWSLLLTGTWAMLASLWTMLFVGLSGAYLLARTYGSRLWAVVVTLVFALSPYLWVDLFVRQALSEFLATLLFVWVLVGLVNLQVRLRAGRPLQPALTLLAVSLALVIYAHPIVGILASGVAGLSCPWLAFRAQAGTARRRLSVAVAPALGLMLSAPYWLVFVSMKRYVSVDSTNTGYFDPVRHTVEFQQFFSRQWDFGVSVANSPADTMPFQLGAAHFVLALSAALWGWRQTLAPMAATVYGALIVAMTPWGTWVWRLPVLEYTQFPWRALSIATGLQCLLLALAGGWFDRVRDQWRRMVLAGLLVGGVALWQAEQFQVGESIPNANAKLSHDLAHATENFLTYNGKDEFRPRTSRVQPTAPRGDRPLLETSAGGLTLDGASRHSLRASLLTSTSAVVTINQLYLPGWVVKVNGDPVQDAVLQAGLLPDGRMRLSVHVPKEGEPHRFRISAAYGAPSGERPGIALALLALLLLGLPQLRRLRCRAKAQRLRSVRKALPDSEGETVCRDPDSAVR